MISAGRSKKYRARMHRFLDEVTVYPVSCERLASGRTDEQWLDAVLAGGARIVQLRDKHSPDRRLLEKARYFRRRTLETGTLFLVNDRLDIAMLADADGIHVGQEDIPPDDIAALAPDMLIGQSCNTMEQAEELVRLEEAGSLKISYYNIGPVFPTLTKEGLVDFIGPEAIGRFSARLSIPFTVMGGIKLQHVDQLTAMGVHRIALVTALTQAADIQEETGRWVDKINNTRIRHD